MPRKYCIHLTESERSEFKALRTAGKAAAPKRLRARILLTVDRDHPGGAMKDAEIVRAPGGQYLHRGARPLRPGWTWPANRGARLAAATPNQPPQSGRVDGSPLDSGLLRRSAGGPFPLDAQTAGRSRGGAGSGGQRQPPDHWQGSLKNELKDAGGARTEQMEPSPQRFTGFHRLAIHHQGRTCKTQAPLPIIHTGIDH